jgi:hypothetical protein
MPESPGCKAPEASEAVQVFAESASEKGNSRQDAKTPRKQALKANDFFLLFAPWRLCASSSLHTFAVLLGALAPVRVKRVMTAHISPS